MFEGLKRLLRKITAPSDDDPESFDHPRPRRVNPDPPRKDWYARVRSRSLRAHAAAEANALDVIDEDAPSLSRDASRQVDELLANMKPGAPGTAQRR